MEVLKEDNDLGEQIDMDNMMDQLQLNNDEIKLMQDTKNNKNGKNGTGNNNDDDPMTYSGAYAVRSDGTRSALNQQAFDGLFDDEDEIEPQSLQELDEDGEEEFTI